MLHEQNAPIFSLLPSLAPGLIFQTTYSNVIVKFIRDEMARLGQSQPTVDRLEHVKDQLLKSTLHSGEYTLEVDEQKSLILAYAFGEIYTPALALVTGKHITVQFWGAGEEQPGQPMIRNCVLNPESCDPIFFEVLDDPQIDKRRGVLDVNPFLQVRGMVSKLGLLLNLSTFDLEELSDLMAAPENSGGQKALFPANLGVPTLETLYERSDNGLKYLVRAKEPEETKTNGRPNFSYSSKSIVDPNNWFCSCSDFTSASFVIHDASGSDLLGDTGHELLSRLFRAAVCKFPKSLPICRHLLAVLLMLFNWDTAWNAGLVRVCWIRSETEQTELRL
ncbi:hypothetical protein METBIDRAFT_150121 [Metschnikowia bicuspidata var. bicuspidata NRRL YB-4993]|uniref:SWIM-type domain-containing protein n=1 Tax=Metschnikowia bicuspidata var. bicuspidata NRRL YB-4993 TaxID=869754 RepID=A0A1A0HEE9_9ASCO|nr:hypothetical protein METBIDRAFT_150121 [Metschnikowia bicuspidata var. bicuspidata NRRL YB-4993]OBA22277.1 hypothetical protein METBIDRAFT_150121 [Metschnikowia bicuspidata var. bicuspidata NRRL YB-4993]